MASLLQRYARTNRCLNPRPSRDDYRGMNHDSIQAAGLTAWWPIWEPMAGGSATAQRAPQALDYGPFGLHMTPSVNTLHVPDPMMGTCWLGSVATGGITGLSSWQSHSRPYNNGATGRDPVDFGALPNGTVLAQAYMATSWIKTDEDARRYRNGSPLDVYVYTFDRNDSFGFPGHNLGLIMRIPNGGATTADASATMYDNDSFAEVPFGVQSLQVVNDGQWHLLCGFYFPLGTHVGGAYNTGFQCITVDGEVGFVGGNDNQLSGVEQPFGMSSSQVNLGSPNDAGHTAGSAVRQFIGCDDDGISSSFVGYIGDHRLYTYDWMVRPYFDCLQFALQQARSMYSPETRWELYYAPPRRSYSLPQGAAAQAAAAVSGWEEGDSAPLRLSRREAWSVIPR